MTISRRIVKNVTVNDVPLIVTTASIPENNDESTIFSEGRERHYIYSKPVLKGRNEMEDTKSLHGEIKVFTVSMIFEDLLKKLDATSLEKYQKMRGPSQKRVYNLFQIYHIIPNNCTMTAGEFNKLAKQQHNVHGDIYRYLSYLLHSSMITKVSSERATLFCFRKELFGDETSILPYIIDYVVENVGEEKKGRPYLGQKKGQKVQKDLPAFFSRTKKEIVPIETVMELEPELEEDVPAKPASMSLFDKMKVWHKEFEKSHYPVSEEYFVMLYQFFQSRR